MIVRKNTSINGKLTPKQQITGRITNQNAQINGQITEGQSKIVGSLCQQTQRINGNLNSQDIKIKGSVKQTSIINYNNLYNKPAIEGVVLEGNKTFEELNLVPLSNADLAQILD